MVASVKCVADLIPAREHALRTDKKAQRFHAWGGKRSDIQSDTYNKLWDIFQSKHRGNFVDGASLVKRKFHAWGGKRSDVLTGTHFLDSYLIPENESLLKGKRVFNAWNDMQPTRSTGMADLPQLKWHLLSQKRASKLLPPNEGIVEDLHSLTRRRFQPWGGK